MPRQISDLRHAHVLHNKKTVIPTTKLYPIAKYALIMFFVFLLAYYFFIKSVIDYPQQFADCGKRRNAGDLLEVPNNHHRYIHAMHNESRLKSHFQGLYKVRVPGSPQHQEVQNHIRRSLESLGWWVSEDKFSQATLIGHTTFTNLVAVHNPSASHRLVLACHYDSKVTPKGFLGATDSAVPCAMLLDLAEQLTYLLNQHKNDDLTVELIFFDGEEAFVEWTDEDSLYGSRHLAQRYATENHPRSSTCTKMATIDLFVLLDLLGAPLPKFRDYHESGSQFYRVLHDTEKHLRRQGLLKTSPDHTMFPLGRANGGVADDHVPFLRRGVRILHLIPSPFPYVWHSLQDTQENLDWDAVHDVHLIIRFFVLRYLHIDTHKLATHIGQDF